MKELVIHDGNWKSVLQVSVGGEIKGTGQKPRDFSVDPPEMFAPPSDMELIPRSEWSARIKEMEATKSRLSDLREGIPSLDQGQVGYCWAHSTTHCVMLLNRIANQPYVPLSAYSVAAIIKGGADEGAWCGLSAKFLREVGVATQEEWPQGSRDVRRDTPALRQSMGKRKVTEEWVDLTRQVWETDLTFDQLATCLLNRIPCAIDLNFWGHSVCALDLVEVERNSFGVRIWNSWGDAWENKGMAILAGSKAIPDGAVALRTAKVVAA